MVIKSYIYILLLICLLVVFGLNCVELIQNNNVINSCWLLIFGSKLKYSLARTYLCVFLTFNDLFQVIIFLENEVKEDPSTSGYWGDQRGSNMVGPSPTAVTPTPPLQMQIGKSFLHLVMFKLLR